MMLVAELVLNWHTFVGWVQFDSCRSLSSEIKQIYIAIYFHFNLSFLGVKYPHNSCVNYIQRMFKLLKLVLSKVGYSDKAQKSAALLRSSYEGRNVPFVLVSQYDVHGLWLFLLMPFLTDNLLLQQFYRRGGAQNTNAPRAPPNGQNGEPA